MRTIAKLFGRSPFVPIQQHMERVARCVSKAQAMIDAYLANDQPTVEKLAAEIDEIEETADHLKRDIESQLRGGVFMAVDRGRLRQIIIVQDTIADKMQNLGKLLTLRACGDPPPFVDKFRAFVQVNLDTFEAVRKVIDELDNLLDAGFAGGEAQTTMELIRRVAELEAKADVMQHDLLKELFAHESELTVGSFFLWTKILKQVSDLGDRSHRLGNRIRGILQLN